MFFHENNSSFMKELFTAQQGVFNFISLQTSAKLCVSGSIRAHDVYGVELAIGAQVRMQQL
jgi:hypothetical protein